MSYNSGNEGAKSPLLFQILTSPSSLPANNGQDHTPDHADVEEVVPPSVVIKVENGVEDNYDIDDPLSDPLDTNCNASSVVINGSTFGTEDRVSVEDTKIEGEVDTAAECFVRIKVETEEWPGTFDQTNDETQFPSESNSENGNIEISGFKLRDVSVRLERIDVTDLLENENSKSTFECTPCSLTFAQKRDLEEHLKGAQHLSGVASPSLTPRRNRSGMVGQAVSSEPSTIKKKYPCKKCGKEYSSSQYLKCHKCTAERHEASNNDTPRDGRNSTQETTQFFDSSSLTTKNYSCPFCGLIVCSMISLCEHMNQHTGMRLFRCKECGKTFISEHAFAYHQNVHTLPFACKICGKKFSRLYKWKEHYLSHQGANPLCCPRCGITFSSVVHLNRHSVLHKRALAYPCISCGETFSSRSLRINHYRIAHDNEIFFPCVFCGKNFFSLPDLNKHMLMFHETDQSFRCYLCEASFPGFDLLRKHFGLNHKDRKFPFPDIDAETLQVNPEDQHNVKNSFNCKVCGKDLPSTYSLKQHINSHKKMNTFFCFFCEKVFSTYRALVGHTTGFHRTNSLAQGNMGTAQKFTSTSFYNPKRVLYKAIESVKRRKLLPSDKSNGHNMDATKLSGNSFEEISSASSTEHAKNNISLSQNEANMGDGSETNCGSGKTAEQQLQVDEGRVSGQAFYCNVCRKSFSSLGFFKVHQRTHSKSLPLRRKNRALAQSNILDGTRGSGALRKHFNVTGNPLVKIDKDIEKPYICGTCGKAFKRNAYLKAHVRIHTGERPYCCSVCRRTFSYRASLYIHMKSHRKVSERKFVCSTCGKTFPFRSNLKIHERVHSGKTPFRCPVCGIAFRFLGTLGKHMKTHRELEKLSLEKNLLPCISCGLKYQSVRALRRHMRRTHKHSKACRCQMCIIAHPFEVSNTLLCVEQENALENGRRKEMDVSQTNSRRRKSLSPGINYNASAPSNNYKNGRRSVPRYVCQESYNLTENSNEEKSLTCDKCGKVLQRIDNFERHKRVHTGYTPHRCSKCGAGFRHNWSLTLHMRNRDCENASFHKVVGKESSVSSRNQQNIRDFADNNFSCNLCGSNYLSCVTLRRHMRCVHMHARSCTCPACIVPYPSDVSSKPKESTFENGTHKEADVLRVDSDIINSPLVKRRTEQRKVTTESFHCNVCGKSFPSFGYLKVHERIHSKSSSLTIKRKRLVRSRNFMNGGRVALKNVCEKNFKLLGDNSVERSHVCGKCGLAFQRIQYLNGHQRVHEGDTPYHCSECGAAFCSKRSLTTHVNNRVCKSSPVQEAAVVTRSSSSSLVQQNLTDRKFQCSLCGSKYPSALNFRRHLKNFHKHLKSCSCDDCAVTYRIRTSTPSVSAVQGSVKRKLPQPVSHKLSPRGRGEFFSCNLCPQIFSSSSLLQEHCTSSHKSLQSFENVSQRNSGKHYDKLDSVPSAPSLSNKGAAWKNLSFRCDLCCDTFETGASLSQHYRQCHNKLKLFRCDMCGKEFANFEYYSVHLRMHMGEHPYCCEVCGKSFSSSSNLSAHKSRAHRGVEEQLFICAVCSEAFTDKNDFKIHCSEHHSEIFLP